MLTQQRLKDLLHYCEETGCFTRRVTKRSGSVAGGLDDKGYIRIRVDGKRYRSHRLAWMYTHGYWPASELDHINGDRSDNRIANLREASRSENMRNQRVRSDNTSGHKGVYWSAHKSRWVAQIADNGKLIHLGYFTDIDGAIAVYVAAAHRLHGAFANLGTLRIG